LQTGPQVECPCLFQCRDYHIHRELLSSVTEQEEGEGKDLDELSARTGGVPAEEVPENGIGLVETQAQQDEGDGAGFHFGIFKKQESQSQKFKDQTLIRSPRMPLYLCTNSKMVYLNITSPSPTLNSKQILHLHELRLKK